MEIPTYEKTTSYLHGGGEMGELTRSYNWSGTSIGPVPAWPVSLRVHVNMMLASRFPMLIFWGPDLLTFYNDAFRPSLGNNGKHPSSLGQRGEESWAESWATIGPMIYNIMAGGEAVWFEDQKLPIYRDGRLDYAYWTYSFSPLTDDAGATAGILVTCTETTKAVESMMLAEQSEQNLRNIISQAPVAMSMSKGANHVVEIASDRMFEIWGKDPKAILGKPVFEAMPEARGQGFEEILQNVLTTGEPFMANEIVVHLLRNGKQEPVYLNLVYQPVREGSGAITGVMQVAIEVTEQVIARKKIEEIDEKLRIAVQSADLGTVELNLLSNEFIVSERLEEIFDVEPGTPWSSYVSALHPDDSAIRSKAFEKAYEDGLLEYEVRVVRRDGTIRWIRAKGSVFFDESAKPLRLVCVVQDTTEQKLFAEELQRRVREQTRELERSNEELQQFAHVASHDLKEPVRKIRTFGSRMKEEFENLLPERAKFYLEKIESSAARMYAMIDGVLQYSSANAVPQTAEKVDLNEIVTQIQEDLEVLIQQQMAMINVNELPVVEGSALLLYQLLYNLLNNALKFTKEGTAPVINIYSEGVISSAHTGSVKPYHVIKVADNGIGFPPSQATAIFETFTRLNAKDKYEGTGLGLALCKKIAERHGGAITAESTEGRGAVFTILLPVAGLL